MGKIDFYAWCRGYAPSGNFSNSGSRRYRDFDITGGAVQTDQLIFIISANILQYKSGQWGYPKSDNYNKYNPRLMIGIYDSTAPHGFDYNPMIGFQFNLDDPGRHKQIYEYFDTEYNAFGYSQDQDEEIAQTFTIGNTGANESFYLYAIKLPLNTLGSYIDFTFRIYNTTSGTPTGSPIKEWSHTISSNGWVLIKSSEPLIQLISGTTYAFSITPMNGGTDCCNLQGSYDASNPYDGGKMWKKNGSWSTPPGLDDTYDIYFKIYGTPFPFKSVSPFLAKDITSSNPTYPEYRHGNWQVTGSSSYKIELVDTYLKFYVDNSLKEVWDISDITLDGGYQFGAGQVYDWDKFRIQLIDTAANYHTVTRYIYPSGPIFSGNANSGNIHQSPNSGYHSDKIDDEIGNIDNFDSFIYLAKDSDYTPGGVGYQEIFDSIISSQLLDLYDELDTVQDFDVYITATHSGNGTISYGQPVIYIDGIIGYSPESWGSFYPGSWSTVSRDMSINPSTNTNWTISSLKRCKLGYLCTNSPSNEGSHSLTSLYGKVTINKKLLDSGASISGSITYYSITPLIDPIAISDDSGQSWTKKNDRALNYSLGWNYDYILGKKTASSDNINKYGKHPYTVNESLITTRADAEALAQRYVNTYLSGLKVGTVTIDGRTGIDLQSKFKLSGANINEDSVFEIASYTQRIDQNGFTTTINYGSEPFDIAKKVSNLEREVFGG